MRDTSPALEKPKPRRTTKGVVKSPPPILTRGDGLVERLSDEISASVFAPGSRLDEVTLAARYGVSRTPVREALRQLEATGLIERRPFRGAVVSAPSPQLLADMFASAGEIEAICARLSATSMTTAERNALRKAHDKMGELARAKTSAASREAYAEANVAFHDRIYIGSHNVTLVGFARDLRRRLQPFRRGMFQTAETVTRAYAEQEQIVRAVERKAGDEAAALMRLHTRLDESIEDGPRS